MVVKWFTYRVYVSIIFYRKGWKRAENILLYLVVAKLFSKLVKRLALENFMCLHHQLSITYLQIKKHFQIIIV